MAVAYRKGYPPIVFFTDDGSQILVHKRADGDWGWTKSRSGRKVATNGEGLQRARALDQAIHEACVDPNATAVKAVLNGRGQLVTTDGASVLAPDAHTLK